MSGNKANSPALAKLDISRLLDVANDSSRLPADRRAAYEAAIDKLDRSDWRHAWQTPFDEEIKKAMKAKEQVRLDVLRGVLAAFTNELVAKKRKPDEMLSDENALTVINRLAKQRKDSI